MRLVKYRGRVTELEAHRQAVQRGEPGYSPDWDDLDSATKAEIRSWLVKNQGGLCAYCTRRITAQPDGMRIEHYVPRSADSGRCFDSHNLLGVCTGLLVGELTCDRLRGNRPLAVDPRHTEVIRRITYPPDGRIRIGGDGVMQGDLDDRLGLNLPRHRENRKAALQGMLDAMKQRSPRGRWPRKQLERQLDRLRERSTLPQYLGVIEHWVAKRPD